MKILIALALLPACDVCIGECTVDMPDGGGAGSAAPACTVVGQPHIGLGGEDLAAKNNVVAYEDRARAKPYSALLTEYARVLGAANRPTSIDSEGPTFGQPADRWYIEPLASAVFVNTAYNVAFEGCLRLTGEISGGTADPRFAIAPDAATAQAVCTEWTTAFWDRDATPAQIADCVGSALEATTEVYGGGAIAEVSRPTTPERQWAYACAGLLTTTSFLTY